MYHAQIYPYRHLFKENTNAVFFHGVAGYKAGFLVVLQVAFYFPGRALFLLPLRVRFRFVCYAGMTVKGFKQYPAAALFAVLVFTDPL